MCFQVKFLVRVYRNKGLKQIIALVQPVAMLVGLQCLPGHFGVADGAVFADDSKLLLPVQIVADIDIVDGGFGVELAGIFHQQGYGNGCTGAGTKNLATLFSRKFATGALVASQVKDPDAGKLFLKALTESVGAVAIKPCAV